MLAFNFNEISITKRLILTLIKTKKL